MNKVIISGRLGKDIELKRTANDIPVVSFSLAVDGEYNSKTKERPTYWIDCVAWRGQAEFIARNFSKGGAMELSGHLTTRSWKDKDGNNRISTEVVTETVGFCLGGKKAVELTEVDEEDENLPF